MSNRKGIPAFSVILSFVCLSILAITFIPILSIQLDPTTPSRSISVTFNWPNASAKVLEQEVTSKLEGLFSSIHGLESIQSESSKGEGTITMEFDKNARLDMIRFEISTLIRQAYPKLPDGVSYPSINLGSSGRNIQPILIYTFNGSASPVYVREYAAENIQPEIAKVKGVGNIQISQAPPYTWEIKFNNDQTTVLGITGTEIRNAIETYFGKQNLGKGSYHVAGKDYGVEMNVVLYGNQNTGEINWDIIPVKKVGDRVIYLGDIATTQYRERPPSYYSRINGLNSITIYIYPEPGINTMDLAKEVRRKVNEVREKLPPGYDMVLRSDTTEQLSKDLQKILLRTAFSLGMLLIFVWVTSRQISYMFLIVTTMIMNLLIACIFYYLLKIEIHLYSLVGITISFGIIIDNSIVMIDHLRISNRKNVFLAVLGATLTTVAALSVVFLLNDQQKENLVELAWVVIINLCISLVIAWYLIPAMMEKVRLAGKKKKFSRKRARRILVFSDFYARSIRFGKRFAWLYVLIVVLGFGIPFHLLPEKIETDEDDNAGRSKTELYWIDVYNKTIGNDWFSKTIRPTLEKVIGGSFRLFGENTFSSSYNSAQGRSTLRVTARMPEGSTVHQLNETIKMMENIIAKYDEVESYQTTVSSYSNGTITILFKPEHEFTSFPAYLKGELEIAAIDMGGADWSIVGEGDPFSIWSSFNTLGSSRLVLKGYNYDELLRYADILRNKLLEQQRIKQVDIVGSRTNYWAASINHEYFIDFNKEMLASEDITMQVFHNKLGDWGNKQSIRSVYFDNKLQRSDLLSDRYDRFNLWDFKNEVVDFSGDMAKMRDLGTVEKRRTGSNIYKYDQQYQIEVRYSFIGSNALNNNIQDRNIDAMEDILPLGYTIGKSSYSWYDRNDSTQYYLIFLVIIAIYFICAVLFESLRQPLAVTSLIPIPFIGAFLTFYVFNVNFDQGAYASFVLLTGLVVNAGVFIINDYNNMRNEFPHVNPFRLYVRAFNHKIIPIALTTISTIVGLIPFIYGGRYERFWYSFAMGTTGGLLFSLIAVMFFMPLVASPRGFKKTS